MLMCSKGSWTVGAAIVGASLLLSACTSTGSVRHGTDNASAAPICGRVIQADVVALEQAMVLNRFGAFNPAGMLYALRRDVEFSEPVIRADGQEIPAGSLVSDDNLIEAAGHVRLRADKRPRPLVLRANEGDCLQVRFHNLLTPAHHDELSGDPIQYEGRVPAHLQDPPGKVYPIAEAADAGRQFVKMESVSNDRPLTRAASFHVNGLDVLPVPEAACPVSSERHVWLCGTDGGNVGHNRASVRGALPTELREQLRRQGGQVLPGQSAVYRMYAFREGTYFAYSTGATVGGEGAGGQLGAGLFAAVNVQPAGARWYRSQVTHADLVAAARTPSSASYDDLDYDNSRYPANDAQPYRRGLPILSMLDGDEIVHSDLNAIIVLTGPAPDHGDTTGPDRHCADYVFGNGCGHAYREFTVIMHDEVKAAQAFAELEDPDDPLHYVRDNMGINYGVAGMGAMVVARNRRTGPARNCPECRAEEFFLSSWANGDPALVLKWNAAGDKPIGAMYPDDPSNVHHSYLNDPVRFRNLHAGPKETHVFHLHAHQWVQDASQPGSTYLDSQTISPGATFSYEIEFGGSGNKNLAPGDSIFHCHLYPHFAQGMWELWRVHDVFEDGSDARRLPDAEVAAGTENPALVPLPGSTLPPKPTAEFAGYPFYIPGQPGHRPPQPPLDIDTVDGVSVDGGMPRHVLTGWEDKGNRTLRALSNQHVLEAALAKGGKAAQINARRVFDQNPNALYALAEEWEQLGGVRLLPEDGTPEEKRAMAFHAGTLSASGLQPQSPANDPRNPLWQAENKGYVAQRAATVAGQPAPQGPDVFWVNGRQPVPGAPFADPCPASAHVRDYRVGVIQTELTVNRHGWFDPQARIMSLENDIQDIIDPGTRTHMPEPLFFRANSGDCIDFRHSNFVPNALALDDFQIYTPTDTIGQHIHLVKFDVTSSDGAGNGWNYEDGTFSPEEVRERVQAYNHAIDAGVLPGVTPLKLKTHPLFAVPCATGDKLCEALQRRGACPANAESLPLATLAEKYPFCGAQRTVQRWYADPILDPKTGRDYTLRTVFTHDHFGPSSHQQHGLYAALVVEPANSVWLSTDADKLDWGRLCSVDPLEREAERKKVIGGANLSAAYIDLNAQCREREPDRRLVGENELREPLRLRADGGPTSTRANIVSPLCLFDQPPSVASWGSRKDSNPLDPAATSAKLDCPGRHAPDTRREYALAFADFSVLYNTALEPINPETRDESQLRLGHRQVPLNRPMPLAISSEDPGTQLINYRNEPVPLRIADITPDRDLGGFDYRQISCANDDDACAGDMANVFSSLAHADRDRDIAERSDRAVFAPGARIALRKAAMETQLDRVLAEVEGWRVDFNCALYPAGTLSRTCRPIGIGPAGEVRTLAGSQPPRALGDPATPLLRVYEGDPLYIRLIQGAQEAQHVFAMTNAKWLREPDNPHSGFVSAQPLGISEHFEMNVRVSPLGTEQTDSLYLGSSMDQLWDGMWGLMRSYGRKNDDGSGEMVPVVADGLARLGELPGNPVPLPEAPADLDASALVCGAGNRKAYDDRLRFDISVVRACDLDANDAHPQGSCGLPGQSGIAYNRRLAMDDPDALVYVRNNAPGEELSAQGNDEVLARLRREFAAGQRRIEPLVLHAPAGACLEVKVRNHLPAQLDDGPLRRAPGAAMPTTAFFAENFLSMILDGFNYNQYRMSSSVGLSAPLLAKNAIGSDGANFGENGKRYDPTEPSAFGNLTPPCGRAADQCEGKSMYWYAGEFALDAQGGQQSVPMEFGVVPLSSFADPIKHPAHGLVGALVIGPPGSAECPSDDSGERAADARSSASRNICDANGRLLYRDLVLVLQDAVDARIQGDPVPNLSGAEEPDDYGVKAVNYRSEPLWGRGGGDPSIPFELRNEFDYADVLSSKRNADGESCQAGVAVLAPSADRSAGCDPETPAFVARPGREVRLRVVHPGGHTRQQAFALAGHNWNSSPWTTTPAWMGGRADEEAYGLQPDYAHAMAQAWTVQGAYNGVGPLMSANLMLRAGGRASLPMDYLWRSQASFVFDGGIWGLLRVCADGQCDAQ